MIEFSDGTSVDPRGDLRVEERDGVFFVVGDEICIPFESRQEAEALLRGIADKDLLVRIKLFKSSSARKRVADEFRGDPANAPKQDPPDPI